MLNSLFSVLKKKSPEGKRFKAVVKVRVEQQATWGFYDRSGKQGEVWSLRVRQGYKRLSLLQPDVLYLLRQFCKQEVELNYGQKQEGMSR